MVNLDSRYHLVVSTTTICRNDCFCAVPMLRLLDLDPCDHPCATHMLRSTIRILTIHIFYWHGEKVAGNLNISDKSVRTMRA